MAITYTAAGTEVATTTTTLTMSAPAALPQDILFAVINSNNNTAVTPPQGWTTLYDTANTAAMQTYVGWKRAGINDSLAAFAWTVAGTTVSFGVIVGYRGAVDSGNPIAATTISSNAAADDVTYATLQPRNLNHIVAFGTYGLGATTSTTFSGTNPTMTERVDVETATGNTASLFVWDGPILTFAATGARTLSTASTVDAVNQGILVELVAYRALAAAQGDSPTYPAVRRGRF